MIKSGSATILSSTARLAGELVTDEDIILAGTFEGAMRTNRSVQIAATGRLEGEIQAESVLVLGHVTGPIQALDRIELQAGAVVHGDMNAQRVRIHDDVVFNGRCSITGPEAGRKQYLVPALVQVFGEAADSQALARLQTATEAFLATFGFEVEVRPDRDAAHGMRPIFRSRDALAFSHLRERLRSVEEALQAATAPEPGRERRFGAFRKRGDKDEDPLQVTGADGARALVEALGALRNATLMLGPVIVTRFEADRGPRLGLRVRPDSLSTDLGPAAPPDPSALLVAMQKVQTEVARDLGAATAARARPHD